MKTLGTLQTECDKNTEQYKITHEYFKTVEG
jgi:hypothetical protein